MQGVFCLDQEARPGGGCWPGALEPWPRPRFLYEEVRLEPQATKSTWNPKWAQSPFYPAAPDLPLPPGGAWASPRPLCLFPGRTLTYRELLQFPNLPSLSREESSWGEKSLSAKKKKHISGTEN